MKNKTMGDGRNGEKIKYNKNKTEEREELKGKMMQ